jgi:hypothetical protein
MGLHPPAAFSVGRCVALQFETVRWNLQQGKFNVRNAMRRRSNIPQKRY